jgi:hypothetical protein
MNMNVEPSVYPEGFDEALRDAVHEIQRAARWTHEEAHQTRQQSAAIRAEIAVRREHLREVARETQTPPSASWPRRA